MFDIFKKNIDFLLKYNDKKDLEVLLNIPEKDIIKISNFPENTIPIKLGTAEKRWDQEQKTNKILNQTVIAFTNAKPIDLANFIMEYNIEDNLLYTSDLFMDYIKTNEIFLSIIEQDFSERIFDNDKDRFELYYYETMSERGLRIGLGKQVFMLNNKNEINIFRQSIKYNQANPFEEFMDYEGNQTINLCARIMNANNTKLSKSQFTKLSQASPDALNYITNQLKRLTEFSTPTPRTINNIIDDAIRNY
jgi:hypothetical protein